MRFDNPHYPVATSCPLWPVPEWSPICGSREDALTRRPYQTRAIPIPVTPVVLGPGDRVRRAMFVVQGAPAEKRSDLGPFLAALGIVAGIWLLYSLSEKPATPIREPSNRRGKKARRGNTTSGP